MKFFGLLAMASAAVALPVLDNVMAGKTKGMPLFSHFGNNKKTMTKATGNGKATGTGNFLHGLTEMEGLTIPKRDAAPKLSELTVGVQGGEVVKREAKNLPLNFGSKGVDGTAAVKSLPLNMLTGILKRWIGMQDAEETNVIEKRAGKKMRKGGKMRKMREGKGMRMRKSGPPTGGVAAAAGGGGPLGQLDTMKNDGADTGGVGVLGMPLPIGEKKE